MSAPSTLRRHIAGRLLLVAAAVTTTMGQEAPHAAPCTEQACKLDFGVLKGAKDSAKTPSNTLGLPSAGSTMVLTFPYLSKDPNPDRTQQPNFFPFVVPDQPVRKSQSLDKAEQKSAPAATGGKPAEAPTK